MSDMTRKLVESGGGADKFDNVDVDHYITDDDYGAGAAPNPRQSQHNTQIEFEFQQSVHTSSLDLEGDIDASDSHTLLPPPAAAGSGGGSSGGAAGGVSCFSIEYYQKFFDVDTEQVQYRLKASVWPYKNAFLKTISGKGDLYGPFWVASTLIFVIAFAGNIVDYNNSYARGEQDVWRYDFSKISLAATMIYGYVSLIPFGVWVVLKYRTAHAPLLMDLVTLYGYSIAIFIPVSFLCIFPWIGAAISWLAIIVAIVLSGLVVSQNLYEALREVPDRALVTPFVGAIAVCHLGLGLALKFYFFHHVQYHPATPTVVLTTAVPRVLLSLTTLAAT
eukprot:m.7763 g.7763  ORF g.7763 m.7763 type:complete len:333 (-) comp2475_c0_seq2:198-1196(-)